MNIKIDPLSFALGITTFSVIALILWVVISNRRHRCSCGNGTYKVCKLFSLTPSPDQPYSTKTFLLYIFRVCNSKKHAKFTIKVVTLDALEILSKKQTEFDTSDEEFAELCKLAGTKHPACMSLEDLVSVFCSPVKIY